MTMGKHICGRCGGEFTSKAKCWYHMDFECPKNQPPPDIHEDLSALNPRQHGKKGGRPRKKL